MGTPFKMKAGKEGPMKKNFPSAFKNDTESVQDNTKTTKAKKVTARGSTKEQDDFVGDFFNKETLDQANTKVLEANRAKRKAARNKKAKEDNAKKRAEIAKKEAEYMKKAKAHVKSGKKGKDYQTKADLKKKIKIIKDNS